MALAAKPSNAQTMLRSLFDRNGIPLSRPEYQEYLSQAETLFSSGIGSESMILRSLELRIHALSNQIQEEKAQAIEKIKAEERSIAIASKRTLAPVRLNNSQILMAYPWFSPDQRIRKDYFEYTSPSGSVKLGVHPSPKYGAAKVWDGDILMYALSKAVKAYLETKEFPRKVEFTAYEYLKQSGKNDSGKNRKDLKDRLNRLGFTQYEFTHISPITKKETGGRSFKLCDVSWANDENERLETIILYFSEELFEYFATKNDLLTLKKDLLLEAWKEDRSGLRKRLLMLVGTRLGEQSLWKVSLLNLRNLCGYDRELKYFKRDFQKLIPSLPWFADIEKNKNNEDIVSFIQKP